MKESKEKIREAENSIDKARILAAHMGELLFAQDETVEQKIIAAGILFAGMAAMGGMPIEIAIALLKNVYENASDFVEIEGQLQ
jgi:hypothetical protein